MYDEQSDETPPRHPIEERLGLNLRQLALIAFVIGVLFHACVVFAVLDDGAEPAGRTSDSAPSTQQRTPTPTRPPDRTDCAAIRGTDYRSESERQWFQLNCGGGLAPGNKHESPLS